MPHGYQYKHTYTNNIVYYYKNKNEYVEHIEYIDHS